jgi:6-phospho-3-hexuloisomerase
MMQFATAAVTIEQEVARTLSTVQEGDVQALLRALLNARSVFVFGAGRVGLAAQAFAMRLAQLGLRCVWVGDITMPPIGPGDLLLVCSGSGETATVRVVAELAVKRGADVATITRDPQASIGRLCRVAVRLGGKTAIGEETVVSQQPLVTLWEQALFLLLDGVVMLLMERLGQTSAAMKQRSMNLE